MKSYCNLFRSCCKCKEVKYHDQFFVVKKPALKKGSTCRTCEAKRGTERKMIRHGIRPEDYYETSRVQGGVCAICKTVDTTKVIKNRGETPLIVDHDHRTGALRGLLCYHCNVLLGHAKDNPEILTAAANYLHNPPGVIRLPRPVVIRKGKSPKRAAHLHVREGKAA